MSTTTDTRHPLLDLDDTGTPARWRLVTYRQFEVRSGIYWEAMLMYGRHRVGTVVQQGNGGADEVIVTHPAARSLWTRYVATFHSGNEEQATYALMVEEDSTI
jgi:hypothetical protein